MRPLDPRWRVAPPAASERLPILVGVAPAKAQPGRQTASPQIRAALALLSEFDHSRMAGMVEIERMRSDPAAGIAGDHEPKGANYLLSRQFRDAVPPLADYLRSVPAMGQGHRGA